MLGLRSPRRTNWNFVTVGSALALGSLATAGVPIAHKVALTLGITGVGLLIVLAGIFDTSRRDPKELIELVTEGAQILNEDPMDLILDGEPRDPDMALSAFDMRIHLWREEVMHALRRAHATAGELQSFDILGKYEPLGPGMSPRHVQAKGILSGRIERLRVIIHQMEAEQS